MKTTEMGVHREKLMDPTVDMVGPWMDMASWYILEKLFFRKDNSFRKDNRVQYALVYKIIEESNNTNTTIAAATGVPAVEAPLPERFSA